MRMTAQKLPPEISTILFDLDGTLIDVEMHAFIPAYLQRLAGHFAGTIQPERFMRVAHRATMALVHEPGDGRSNRERFTAALDAHLGLSPECYAGGVAAFAADGLAGLAGWVRPVPMVQEMLASCRQRGLELVLATNPVFPPQVIQARIRWGGLESRTFRHVSDDTNTCHCKPHPGYFRELLDHLGRSPEECLMVGNDSGHDLAAGRLGIRTFLVDTFLIERATEPIVPDFRGDHAVLARFLAPVR